MGSKQITYQLGIPAKFLSSAAGLYDEAFGQKFMVAVRSDASRIQLLENCLLLDYAIGAIYENNLIGIAGIHTSEGSLTGGTTYLQLLAQLGFLRGNRAALIFSLYERKPRPGELLMDGVAVHADARGKGVGSRLLEEVAAYAKAHDFERIRLAVIDINSGARKLYERKGFKAVKTESFPYLRGLLGFGGSTTMELGIK